MLINSHAMPVFTIRWVFVLRHPKKQHKSQQWSQERVTKYARFIVKECNKFLDEPKEISARLCKRTFYSFLKENMQIELFCERAIT